LNIWRGNLYNNKEQNDFEIFIKSLIGNKEEISKPESLEILKNVEEYIKEKKEKESKKRGRR
jgi:hypothetical protein